LVVSIVLDSIAGADGAAVGEALLEDAVEGVVGEALGTTAG